MLSNIPTLKDKVSYTSMMNIYYNRFLSLLDKQLAEEKVQGSSCIYTIMQLYVSCYFLAMFIKKRMFYGDTLDEATVNFDMDAILNNLAHNHINLYDVYDAFDITYS